MHAKGGTNRYATIFFYLNDVAEGGQTGFPKADALDDEALAKLSPELVPVLSSHKLGYNKTKLDNILGRDHGMEAKMAKPLSPIPLSPGYNPYSRLPVQRSPCNPTPTHS